MAVSKRASAESSIDVRTSADERASAMSSPATQRLSAESKPPAGFHDVKAMTWGWNLPLLRAGAALLTGFETLYLIVDYFIPAPLTPADAALHAAAIGLTLCVVALSYSQFFERHWRLVCFANLVAIYVLSLNLRVLTGDMGPLSATLTLTLIGTGAMLEWSAGWQAGLSAIALVFAPMPELMAEPVGRQTAYRYLGVVLAIALGHFILAMRERYRAEVAQWMDRSRTSHRELAGALAESAAIMSHRERAEGRLREGEAMLGKVFDSAPDNIAITRMSDGATLEVNREFLKTGYTREELIGVSAFKLGRWSRSSTTWGANCTHTAPRAISRPSSAIRMAGRCHAWFRRPRSSLAVRSA
jgi:PAS domain-containing protein